MQQTIKATEKELAKIFCNDYRFAIPDYQRPYAWTVEHTDALLDDLMIALDDATDGDKPSDFNKAIDKAPPYFLGSIVLIKDPKDSRAQVVDGQQRLTTLTILFCVLRELAKDDNAPGINGYVCEKGDWTKRTEDCFHLTLRARDRDFFENNVQTGGRLRDFISQGRARFTDSQQHIHENAKYLWDKLLEVDEAKRKLLTMFLALRCYLVVVAASDQNSAYRVFSVMNARGLDLSPTDILKAEIIGTIKDDERTKYTNRWEEIEEKLGRDDFNNLFAHIRMIHMKTKQQRTLNQEFQDNILKKINGSRFIDDELTPLSDAYYIVSRAAYESADDADKVNSYLRYLAHLDNHDWMPPATAFFHENRDNQEALLKFARDLERLAYALFILRYNVNHRIGRYAAVLRAIEQGGHLYSEGAALQLTEEEKSCVLLKLKGPIYQKTQVCKPLLLRLNGLLTDGPVSYDQRKLSVEHVLPQAPRDGSVWKVWFPDDFEREQWTHSLANLVLLSRQKNTRAQNYDFDRKKREYFQRGGVVAFAITTQVVNEDVWTPAVLERRQSRLIDQLETEWRLGS